MALRVYSFRAHNQFLEVGLKWGLVGVALCCLLLFLLLPGVPLLSPGALGLLGLYLFFWFDIPEGEGAVWTLWGASVMGCKGKRKGSKPLPFSFTLQLRERVRGTEPARDCHPWSIIASVCHLATLNYTGAGIGYNVVAGGVPARAGSRY